MRNRKQVQGLAALMEITIAVAVMVFLRTVGR